MTTLRLLWASVLWVFALGAATQTETITVSLTDTQTRPLPPVGTFFENFVAGNDSLVDVNPGYAASINSKYWVDPPYSLRVEATVTQIKLGASGVLRAKSLSWWFRLGRETEKVTFFVAPDYHASGEPGSVPYSHMVISAGVFEGIRVDTGFRTETVCGVAGVEYGVLPETWHLLAVDFDFEYGSEWNSTRGSPFNVSLDGALLCPGGFWNDTDSMLTVLHVAPQQREVDSWCHNFTSNSSCSQEQTPMPAPCTVTVDEQECLYCCRAESVRSMSDGCCQFNVKTSQCFFSRSRQVLALDKLASETQPQAASCALTPGTVYVDRVHICTWFNSTGCEPVHAFRPFDCAAYRQQHVDTHAEFSTPHGSDYACTLHPRCVWHSERQVCTEAAYSELFGAWQTPNGDDLFFSFEQSATAPGFTPLHGFEAVSDGIWANYSEADLGWTAGVDGVRLADSGGHAVAVLRSPSFMVGWDSRIEVVVNMTDAAASQVFDDVLGPIDLNATTQLGGFLGAAVQWNGAWVAAEKICGGFCTFAIPAESLRPFLHQRVTVDVVDAGHGGFGYFFLRELRILNPAVSVPTPFTRWFEGRACGGVSQWEGLQCFLGDLVDVSLPGKLLSGAFEGLDWAKHGNLSSIDLTGNVLNGTILDELLPLNLVSLSLGDNAFSGTLPSLSRLQSISRVNLSHQGFFGELPEAYFSINHPSFPAAFTALDVSYTGVSGTIPLKLARHPTLEGFRATACSLTGTVPSPLGPRMRDFDVGYNDLSGVAPFRARSSETRDVGRVGLGGNDFVGLIPDWVRDAGSFDVSGNHWCCPVPHWARASAPFDAPTRPRALSWTREHPSGVPSCAEVPLDEPGSYQGVCPTVVGPCDGSLTCGHQTCQCDSAPADYADISVPIVQPHVGRRCPSYVACGCDMRRRRCIYRPQLTAACNLTAGVTICIDEDRTFDVCTDPQYNPYYSPVK
ncbi:Protein STRUBBELIG-RECEPTOR FAMILY 3 [Diplonema papillatum]|nr:Protein STRUBBELIG-RECEPTOR FAMILY 3 [Diplonema papillatum]